MTSQISIQVGEIRFKGLDARPQESDFESLLNEAMTIVGRKLSSQRMINHDLKLDDLALSFNVPPAQIATLSPQQLAEDIFRHLQVDLARKSGRPM